MSKKSRSTARQGRTRQVIFAAISQRNFNIAAQPIEVFNAVGMNEGNEQPAPVRMSLLEAAVASCKCGVTIADASLPDMPLIYINPAFEQITGYTEAETLGKNCRFLQGDSENQHARAQIRNALENGTNLTVVLRNFRRDGTPFWNELHLSPVIQNGTVTHFIGIQNDITPEVEVREALRNLNLEKDKLLGMAAHDLRNPIGLVKSLIDLARDSEPSEIVNLLQMMEDSTDKALHMLGEILNLQTIQAGRIELHPVTVNLHAFIGRVQRSARLTCALKDIRFACESGELPATALFDPCRIEQVLDNLLSNAVKYSYRGTTVTLRTNATDHELVFAVSDQGQGISAEEIPKLFKPFSKTSNIPTEGEPSAGLGLSISKHLVELHGGSISMSSLPSNGSTFLVRIPLAGNEC